MNVTSESQPAAVVGKGPKATPVRPRTSSSSNAGAPLSSVGMLGGAYERFLEMPVAFVLGVLWLAGAALIGSGVLALYLAVSALL